MSSFLARYPDLPTEHLLEHAGITPQLVADPEGMLDYKRWVDFAELVARESGNSGLGAAYAEQLPWCDLGVLGYMIFHSPTLGAALGNACRYQGIQQNVARMTLENARVVFTVDHAAIPVHAQHSEGTLALVTRICREGLADPTWAPRRVRFRHRRPASTATQQQVFRCPIDYDQDVDALELAPTVLREPMRGADPGLLPILLEHANACLATTTPRDDFAAEVTRVVLASLGSADTTIEHVATSLGASPRTIQRRLREEGLAFKDVLARARLSLCERYLGDPSLTLTEAAFLLGYSDLSAFSRAFRRWTGRSALEFRRGVLRRN